MGPVMKSVIAAAALTGLAACGAPNLAGAPPADPAQQVSAGPSQQQPTASFQTQWHRRHFGRFGGYGAYGGFYRPFLGSYLYPSAFTYPFAITPYYTYPYVTSTWLYPSLYW